MSDDFEDVSVVETVENTPSAEPVEPLSEELPAEIEATQINLAPADDVLTQNAQQAYAEQYMPDRAGGNAPITAAGHAAKAAAEGDKKSDLIEHLEQLERRKDWLERDHDFGGMRMSGHDLAKMIDFISNPQMQDKLRERLGKSGVPKEKIDKGMKELNEYIDLKKKEQDGGKLTEEQHRRLKEIEKSEEFKVVAKEAVQYARDNGVKLSMNNSADMTASRVAADSQQRSQAKDTVIEEQAASKKLAERQLADKGLQDLDVPETSKKSIPFVVSSARESLPKTVALTETFTDTIATQVAKASNKTSLAPEPEEISLIDEDIKVANTNAISTNRPHPSNVVASL